MKTKINFILDSIIQMLTLTCAILLVLSQPSAASILLLIVMILFGIRDIEDIGNDFKAAFLNKEKENTQEE